MDKKREGLDARTHSAECWQWHLDCALVMLDKKQQRIKELEALNADHAVEAASLCSLLNQCKTRIKELEKHAKALLDGGGEEAAYHLRKLLKGKGGE